MIKKDESEKGFELLVTDNSIGFGLITLSSGVSLVLLHVANSPLTVSDK